MAFQTGSQINPALGRVDYTPYMQGAVAGAQSIGQGIASLGQSIGSGIEQFYKKKEQKQQEDQATAFVGNLVKSDDRIAKFLGLQRSETGEYDEKALRAGIKTVGAPAILNLANNFQMMEQEQLREQALRQQGIEANKAFGEIVSQFTNPETGEFNLAGAASAAAQKGLPPKAVLDYAETKAKTAAAGVVKQPDLSFQEQQLQEQISAFVQQTGKQPTSAEKAQIMTNIARGAVPQPANPYEQKVADQLFTLDQVAKAAPQQIANIDEQIKLLDEGKVNVGFLGQIEQGIGQIRALLGDKEAAKAVTNTQVLESALGADLIGQIKSAGLTTRSFDTPKEMENLRAALVGSTTLEPATLRQIAELRKKNLKLVIDDYNKKVKSGAYERMYSLYNQQPSVIELGAPMVSPAPAPAPAGGAVDKSSLRSKYGL